VARVFRERAAALRQTADGLDADGVQAEVPVLIAVRLQNSPNGSIVPVDHVSRIMQIAPI
jgi:hypothetical protein